MIFDLIVIIFRQIWNSIKHYFVKIISFIKNIASYFKNPARLAKLKANKKILAVTIKQNLNNGNVGFVNCLFDEDKEEVIDMQESGGIEAEELDRDTSVNFGNKDMIILQ